MKIQINISKAELSFPEYFDVSKLIFETSRSYTSWSLGWKAAYATTSKPKPLPFRWETNLSIFINGAKEFNISVSSNEVGGFDNIRELQNGGLIFPYCTTERIGVPDATQNEWEIKRIPLNEYLYWIAFVVLQKTGIFNQQQVEFFMDKVLFPGWAKGFLVTDDNLSLTEVTFFNSVIDSLRNEGFLVEVSPLVSDNAKININVEPFNKPSLEEVDEVEKEFKKFLTNEFSIVVVSPISRIEAEKILNSQPKQVVDWIETAYLINEEDI